MFGLGPKARMVSPDQALPGRATPIPTASHHFLNGAELSQDVPDGLEDAVLAMGCFWGVERLYWSLDGVIATMVGYAGGYTPNPTYDEVCSGQTGHTEVVRILFDPAKITYADLLKVFWENHDPTQGMRQGNDRGTQYRSALLTTSDAQTATARESASAMAPLLAAKGLGPITTEIAQLQAFYMAEEYHQQYLAKNPGGYCGIKGTGVSCPIALS